MTPFNLARHRNSPHIAFWKMLKQGYDHFEVTRLAPKIDVCEKRYVFNAETSDEFSPAGRCPAYQVPADIAVAVRDKQLHDDFQTAELIDRGTPTAPLTNGGEGGMNQTFLAAISQNGASMTIRTTSGTIPPHVHPPTKTTTEDTEATSAPTPSSSTQIASAVPADSDGIEKFLSWFRSKDEHSSTAGSAKR